MHRNVRRGRIGWVRAARVVRDDERGLWLWVGPGAPVARGDRDGRGMRAVPFTEWTTECYRLASGPVERPPLLEFLPTGAAHSVWFFRDAQGRFASWYVNLEEPGVRWDDGAGGRGGRGRPGPGRGGPSRPQLAVEGRGRVRRAAGATRTHYWVTDEKAVRAEGRRVIAAGRGGRVPVRRHLVRLRPPADWTSPTDCRPAGTGHPCAECVRTHSDRASAVPG